MAGRPREFEKAEVLTRARDCFWAKGFEATSMADLIQHTQVASASLYAAFGSKDSLFRAAIDDYLTHEGRFAEKAMIEEATALRAIERMLRDAVTLFTRRERNWGCMVVTSAINCSDEKLKDWLSAKRNMRTALIVDRLQQAAKAGELARGTDPRALGDLYATLLQGLSVQARDGVPKARLMNMVTAAISLLNTTRVVSTATENSGAGRETKVFAGRAPKPRNNS